MATTVKMPPKPDYEPAVPPQGRTAGKPPRTLKGDLRTLKEKASSARTKWADGREAADTKKREVREEADRILAPAREKVAEEKETASEAVKPVYRVIGAMNSGKTRPYVTSFIFSSMVAWAASPQILVAAYERIRFHTSTTDWGLLYGPGRWFRDTLRMASETGQTGTLVWAIVLGLSPMILLGVRNMSASYLAQGSYRGRFAELGIKWLTRTAYLMPLVYLVGLSYPEYVTALFGSPWEMHWWQVWVMALFCTAYYFTMWVFDRVEKGLGLGYFHVLLMTPLASIVTGAALNAPGAAW